MRLSLGRWQAENGDNVIIMMELCKMKALDWYAESAGP